MKKFLKFFIPIFVFGSLAYYFRAPIQEKGMPFFSFVREEIFALLGRNPCKEPIAYTLGTFDPKFKISREYFLSALSEAEAIWEKPLDINLFDYEPDNSGINVLKINLVYDYRQEATAKLASLGIVVNNNKDSYYALKSKYDSMKSQYEKAKSAFTASLAAYNAKRDAYNQEVNYWNKRGGATREEYAKLQAEGSELNKESEELKAQQSKLNNMVAEINALVVALNRLVSSLNLSVDQYNTVNGTLGESFEEGFYVEEGLTREINIYEFSNHDKLVRVLAHELGHALGLGHVEDPQAIMYKLNQSSSLKATPADLMPLRAKCKVK